MRMTAATLYRDAGAAIEQAAERLVEFQRQVASGKRIERPSHDPQGTAAVIGERAELAKVEQYTRTADTATSRLAVMDAALTSIIDRLTQAQVAIVSAQGSTRTAADREVAAQTLEGVREGILADLNTSFHGIHLFGGAGSTTQPFVRNALGSVDPYQGSTREVAVDIAETRAVTIGMDGSAIAQGGAAADVFAVIDAAVTAARAADGAGMHQALMDLRDAFDRATLAQMRVGTNLASIEDQHRQLAERRLSSVARVSTIEDANLAEAITGMTQAETAYRAALGATNRTTQLSLMDYLS